MYQANFNPNTLRESLNFLIKQGLIEEKPVGKTSTVFKIKHTHPEERQPVVT
jgi:hypothetical protein